MKKRYQVFVSSTFKNLKEERNEVIKALLELDCIPCAMEFFPSSDEEPEKFIQDLMKACDYYIVIAGGTYGSQTNNGISYTEMEYNIAGQLQIPRMAFIHENIAQAFYDEGEDPEKMKKFQGFVSILKTRLFKSWREVEDLGSVVSRSLTQLISTKPQTGWIRADTKTEEHLKLIEEINQLNTKIKDLEYKIEDASDTYSNFDDAWGKSIEETLKCHYDYCVKDSDTLKIKLMGLCLYRSLPNVSNYIRNNRLSEARIELTLLVLDPNCPSWKLLNERWNNLLPVFHDNLNEFVENLKKTKDFDIAVKLYHYNHMPNWHGMLINDYDLYLGTCIWDSNNYLIAGDNLYQHFNVGKSKLHNHFIKMYSRWFDYGIMKGTTKAGDEVIYDSRL